MLEDSSSAFTDILAHQSDIVLANADAMSDRETSSLLELARYDSFHLLLLSREGDLCGDNVWNVTTDTLIPMLSQFVPKSHADSSELDAVPISY